MRKGRAIAAMAALFLALAAPAGVSRAASATLDIPDKYATVEAGDRLYFSLTILYPENDRRQDLRIKYVVRDGDETVATDSVLKAVETQASFTDYVAIPADAKAGLYTVEADIDSYDGTLDEQVSASFQVVPSEDYAATYFYILLGTILAVGTVLFIEIRRVHRNGRQ
jgi:hypothetical protein